ncbi:hypothetical protein ABLV90_04035 [Staphylococcus sp. 2S1]
MVNKPKIFEEFFYNVDNETVDIEELNTYIEKNNRNINKYRGKMFCPECKVAKLTYVSKTTTRRAHLKKFHQQIIMKIVLIIMNTQIKNY